MVSACALGLLMRRLADHEYDLWLMVLWFLGSRLCDPILDWFEHIGKLEEAVAAMPEHWMGGKGHKWAFRVRDGIPKELCAFVMRMVLPRSTDLGMYGPTKPPEPCAQLRRRCCHQCACRSAFLLEALERRIGRRAVMRIYAETANTSTCTAMIARLCEGYDRVSVRVKDVRCQPFHYPDAFPGCERCDSCPAGIREATVRRPPLSVDVPASVMEYSMDWAPAETWMPRDCVRLHVWPSPGRRAPIYSEEDEGPWWDGSRGLHECTAARIPIYSGAQVGPWWDYDPKKPFH
jgi:hypothetical protein